MITYSELRRELVGMFADAGFASAAVDSDLLITEQPCYGFVH